ncbi:MAG: TraB/GumN family protein [Planctomycetes bacterium]|nr:TraB/GumN family protein [Planctomycetota bacterium]
MKLVRHLAIGLTALVLGFAGLSDAQERRARPTDKPFLWQIEGEAPSFLYGTIHVADPRVTALPAVVNKAIDLSDALFTEVSMDAGLQLAMARHVMLPPGEGLSTRVPPDLLERLDAHARRKGLGGAAAFERIKVWCTSLQLQLLEAGPQEGGAKTLDQGLFDRARAQGKEVGGLETIEEQLGCFDQLTDDEQVRMLAAALDGLEAPSDRAARKRPLEELVSKYLAGDLDALVRALELTNAGDDQALVDRMRKALITDRNHRMAERITARLREAPGRSTFYAVGTAHYHGDEGVVALLEAQGFKVRRLSNADANRLRRAPAAAGGRAAGSGSGRRR